MFPRIIIVYPSQTIVEWVSIPKSWFNFDLTICVYVAIQPVEIFRFKYEWHRILVRVHSIFLFEKRLYITFAARHLTRNLGYLCLKWDKVSLIKYKMVRKLANH